MLWLGHEELCLKTINLLPWREEFKEFQRKQFIFFLGFSAVMSLLMIIGLHVFLAERNSQQFARNEILHHELAEVDRQIIEIEGLQKGRQQILARMTIIQRLQANRPNVVKIFEGMAKTVPDGLHFTHVARVKSTINMQGKAESNIRVSKFMRNIESSDWLTLPVLSIIEVEKESETDKTQTSSQAKINEQRIIFNLEAKQTFIEE